MPHNPRIAIKETSKGMDYTFYGQSLENTEILEGVTSIQEFFEVATLLKSPTGLLRVQAFDAKSPIIDICVDRPSLPHVA